MKHIKRITIVRIILLFIIAVLLIFPFESAGVTFLNLFVNEKIVINIKYIIVAFFYGLAIFFNFLECRLDKKYNDSKDKSLIKNDVINRVLIDVILIVLSSQGFIHPIITIVVISRDAIVNYIKITALSKGKDVKVSSVSRIKNLLLAVGVFLTLIYNLPFELYNLKVADIILVIATTLAAITCGEYYSDVKKIIK